MNNLPIIFIMGPTATGKTELAMQLADRLDTEIISVDSAMVYRDMNIGTAKPDNVTLEKYPHHLIDICDPAESYSAASFHEDANKLIQSILEKNKIPILVGGTGLYFRSLEQGLAELPEANYRIRQDLESKATKIGWHEMHNRLKSIDPQSAERINENDSQRIQRALEVYEITGISMSELLAVGRAKAMILSPTKILLMPDDRAELHERIHKRFLDMLSSGLVEEVENLFQRDDLSLDKPAMRLVGYRQVWRHLAGEIDYETMVEEAVAATRQLAKRQMTWFRNESAAKCYEPLEKGIVESIMSIITYSE